jgi:pectinesterase
MSAAPFAMLLPLLSVALLPVASRAQDVNILVSKTSKGTAVTGTDFPTIQMAMDHAPEPGPGGRLFIHIGPGVYAERVDVTENRPRTTFIGMGKDPSEVVITASQYAKISGGTFFSETVRVDAPGFEADNITFQNAAGPVGQAVALAVRSDKAIFKKCRFLGMQDTLFADYGRQYYTDSYITGTVDFIFGNATAVFDHSELHEQTGGYLTAQSRTDPSQTTGYVIANSHITADVAPAGQAGADGRPSHGFYLGRPWRAFSRVVYLNTEMPADLNPTGFTMWRPNDTSTPFYAEFHSTGPGATPATRTALTKQLTASEAKPFEPKNFLAGSDHWDPEAEAAKLP